MSKALVVKGANFALNKVETITLSEPIPCTALSLSESEITFTAIGSTQQITATVTPADTTESVTWLSSNTDCATVEDGLVTCVGVGSATITVACGTQSATCSVTATATIDANTDLEINNGRGIASTDISAGKNYCGITSNDKQRTYYSSVATTSGYKAITNSDSTFDDWYPIMIPKGTRYIKITRPSSFNSSSMASIVSLLDSTSLTTYNTSGKGCRAVADRIYVGSSTNPQIVDLNSYPTCDSFVFSVGTSSAAASTITGDVTVEFS